MFDPRSSRFHFHSTLPLALLGMAALVLVACSSQPKDTTAQAGDKSPAKQADTRKKSGKPSDSVAADAEQFAERLQGAGTAEPANQEVQWTSPMVADPDTAGDSNTAQANANLTPLIKPIAQPQPKTNPTPDVKEVTTDAEPKTTPAETKLTQQQIVARLSKQLKDSAASNDTLRPYLARTALSLFDPARELTEADLGELAAEDRQLILAYQRAFTLLGRSLGESTTEDRQHLQIAATELADQLDAKPTSLRIQNAQLCSRVNGFGVYEPFKTSTFLAGVDRPAIIYAEVENFTPRLESDGQYNVRLTQQVVLYNATDGLAVWRIRPTEITDTSRNRRNDFFVVQLITLPARLGVGKYNLKITLTDEIGQQVDEAEIPIRFVADEKLLSD